MSPDRVVVVVGAGFCGTLVAVHLMRDPGTIRRVVLIERADREIGGVAYSTTSRSHTLNVPAGRMSAFDDDPDSFLRFARTREPALTGGSFVPRRLYGEYLGALLDDARRGAAIPFTRLVGDVVDLEETSAGVLVALADGRTLEASTAVLALGNYPPPDPPGIGEDVVRSHCYARDPWSLGALDADRGRPVLLVGTGLTMFDIALAFRDSNHRGPLIALSRRGLLPQAHRVLANAPHLEPPASIGEWPATALGTLRALRAEVRAAAERGIDWREVVTSIRHDTAALWQRLPTDERRAFLRHLRPYWETHRHRASPETMLAIESMIEGKALRVVAGALLSARLEDDGVAAMVRRRDGEQQALSVGKIVNCTGPDTDFTRVRDPLIASLHARGLIRPDTLGLGLDSDAEGRLLSAAGAPSDRLTLVGSLRKGSLWENTAVPELRGETRNVAARLASEL